MAMPGWADWLPVLGASSAIGALTGGAFGVATTWMTGRQHKARQENDHAALRDRLTLEHEAQERRQALDLEGQRERQHNDHRHQRMQLQQQAHFEARAAAAEKAGAVRAWITRELYDKFGSEADLFPEELPAPPYLLPRSAIADLQGLRATHPTGAVRTKAADLASQVELGHNSVAVGGEGLEEPTRDDMLSWLKGAEELIELINEPPATS